MAKILTKNRYSRHLGLAIFGLIKRLGLLSGDLLTDVYCIGKPNSYEPWVSFD